LQATGFQQCCGINIISGFPFDSKNLFTEREVAKIGYELPAHEGTYAPVHLIALNHQQKMAEAEVLAAGYTLIGDFESAHKDGQRVNVYAKGLTLFPEAVAKLAPAPKIKRLFSLVKRGRAKSTPRRKK